MSRQKLIKRAREVLETLERDGIVLVSAETKNNGHYRLVLRKGSIQITHGLAFSPSDHRGDMNSISQIRRRFRELEQRPTSTTSAMPLGRVS